MRTLVDLDEARIEALDSLARAEKCSRAALIRRAIDDYLARRQRQQEDAFGLWSERRVDGPTYQERQRDEW